MSPSLLLPLMTGETTTLSLVLRTRDNADHAGHSLPLALLRELMPSRLESLTLTPSNNWLIATESSTAAAMEVLSLLLSLTSTKTVSLSRASTHTLEMAENLAGNSLQSGRTAAST